LPRLPLLLESGPLNVFITSDQEEELEGGVLKAINERRQTAQEVGGELLPDELYRVRVCCCPLSSFQCWGSIMELRACKLRGDLTIVEELHPPAHKVFMSVWLIVCPLITLKA